MLASSWQIKVYFPNGQEGRGFLRHYDLDYNVAYMQAKSFPGLQEVFLGPQLQIGPHSQVVAGFKSGKLLAAAGIVTDVPTEKYMTSTCKITRVRCCWISALAESIIIFSELYLLATKFPL